MGKGEMVSGKRLSENEKEYTREHAKDKSKCEIAKNLGELFEEDNGGARNVITVRRFIQREGLED